MMSMATLCAEFIKKAIFCGSVKHCFNDVILPLVIRITIIDIVIIYYMFWDIYSLFAEFIFSQFLHDQKQYICYITVTG